MIFLSGVTGPEINAVTQSQGEHDQESQQEARSYQMPEAIGLNTSGLKKSKRIEALRKKGDIPVYYHMSKRMLLACVTFFGVFCT